MSRLFLYDATLMQCRTSYTISSHFHRSSPSHFASVGLTQLAQQVCLLYLSYLLA